MRVFDQSSNSETTAPSVDGAGSAIPSERNVNDPAVFGDVGAGATDLPNGRVGTGLDDSQAQAQSGADEGATPAERNVNDPSVFDGSWSGAGELPGGPVGTGVTDAEHIQADAYSSEDDIFDFIDVDEMLNGNSPAELAGVFDSWDAPQSGNSSNTMAGIFAGTNLSDLDEIALDDADEAGGTAVEATETSQAQSLDEWINVFLIDVDDQGADASSDPGLDYGFDEGSFV